MSASFGAIDTSRDWPSMRHWRAALTTAARAQPPPIQPSSIEPSGPIKALAPAFAAVTETVRTTVASANAWPRAWRRAACSSTPISDSRQIRLERREALETMRGGKQIKVGQRRLHAARAWLESIAAGQRVEPNDAFAAPPQFAHRRRKQFRRSGVVAVRQDHHAGAGMDDAPRVDAIERRQALADLCTAPDAGRHQRKPVESARRIALSERGGNMRKPGMKQEGLGFAKDLSDGVQEAGEERDIGFHRARCVEQGD